MEVCPGIQRNVNHHMILSLTSAVLILTLAISHGWVRTRVEHGTLPLRMFVNAATLWALLIVVLKLVPGPWSQPLHVGGWIACALLALPFGLSPFPWGLPRHWMAVYHYGRLLARLGSYLTATYLAAHAIGFRLGQSPLIEGFTAVLLVGTGALMSLTPLITGSGLIATGGSEAEPPPFQEVRVGFERNR
jgi:hypothetical protein